MAPIIGETDVMQNMQHKMLTIFISYRNFNRRHILKGAKLRGRQQWGFPLTFSYGQRERGKGVFKPIP